MFPRGVGVAERSTRPGTNVRPLIIFGIVNSIEYCRVFWWFQGWFLFEILSHLEASPLHLLPPDSHWAGEHKWVLTTLAFILFHQSSIHMQRFVLQNSYQQAHGVTSTYYNVITTPCARWVKFGSLVVLGLTALWDNISVYIGPSPIEREKEKRSNRWEKKCPNNPHPHLLQAQ